MAIGLEPAISTLESVKTQWEAIRPNVAASLSVNNVTLQPHHIDRWLDEVLRLLNVAEQQENPDMIMLAIHLHGVLTQCQQIKIFVTQFLGNQTQSLLNIVNSLWGLKSSLLWLLPPGTTDWENWPSRSAEIQETLASISQTYSEASQYLEKIKSLQGQIETIRTSIPGAEELVTEIKTVSQEVTNAKTSAEGSAANAAAKKEEAAEYAKTLNDLVTEQNNLLSFFETKKSEVESTLEGASKVALAASFNTLQTSHKTGKDLWGRGFYFGIAAMALIEIAAALLPGYFPSLTKDGWLVWLISRVVIISPVIWFTWFATLQYSRAMRLEEDYAFKSATAQSFYGYRREMDGDSELVKLLQENAIRNFGANPTRVLGKNDPGSPLHDLIDKLILKGVMDKNVLEKCADFLKDYVAKK